MLLNNYNWNKMYKKQNSNTNHKNAHQNDSNSNITVFWIAYTLKLKVAHY